MTKEQKIYFIVGKLVCKIIEALGTVGVLATWTFMFIYILIKLIG